MGVIVGIHLGQRLRVDALTALVCTAIDGVTPITSPVLGHSCARCSGRAHMKSSTRGRGRRARACVRACVRALRRKGKRGGL